MLVSFHGGFLWIDNKLYVDVDFIASITRLPLAGIDPTLYFRKYQELILETKMNDRYGLCRDTRGFLVNSINDHTLRFVVNILDTKLMKIM